MARSHPLLLAASAVVVIAALRLGRGIFVPIALAVVLSLLLAPLVRALERLRLPRSLGAPLVVLLFSASVAGLGLVVTRQAVDLIRDLPRYRVNIEAKLTSLRPVSRFAEQVEKQVKEIAQETPPPRPRPPDEPVKVEVVDSGPDQLTLAGSALSFVMHVAQTAAVALLLVMFFLVNPSDLVDRIIRLAGPGRVNVTTQALYEAAHGVSRYLGTQALVNGGFGLTLGTGLLVIGVPNALLWGLLAALLRFLPYVGPIVGCSLPVLLSLAVFEGWARPLATIGFILVIELLLNNLVEPLVYGARTGLAPVAIVLSAVAWGWLWGPLGLLLAVPLAVCLAALGRCVPSLRFLGVILGSEVAIAPPLALYHRLLATNHAQALDLVERARGEQPLGVTCDHLLLPVLAMTAADVEGGGLEPTRAGAVLETVRQLLGELEDDEVADAEGTRNGASVLCLPAGTPADELLCEMLCRSLAHDGHRARSAPRSPLVHEKVELVEQSGADVVCLGALSPPDLLRVRYLYKKLRLRFPDLPVVVVVWGIVEDDLEAIAPRIVPDGRSPIATTLVQALHATRLAAQGAGRPVSVPAG